jgi:predicted nucleic acid-binding protein
VLESAFSGGCDLIVSEPILEELRWKLPSKFGWPDAEIDRAVEVIRRNAIAVKPNLVVTDCIDPKDNMFLQPRWRARPTALSAATSICCG